jgi:hypothetical protein
VGKQAGRTPLMSAAWKRSTDTVDILLLAGADVDKADSVGNSVLYFALMGGDEEIIEKIAARMTAVVGWNEIFKLISRKKLRISKKLQQLMKQSLETGRYYVWRLFVIVY